MSETQSTAVATQKKLPADIQARVDENKARNQAIAAIRGTVWSKDLNETQIRCVAQYCRENGLDAVRHVEILGGKIYLTSEFYDERGASLIRDGVVQPDEPDYINVDDRLEKLSAAGDQWAKAESERRLRERIKWSVPEGAKACVVQRFRLSTGAKIIGVNWVGGTQKRDPVGEAEPAKTAATRARRRAWKQIADVLPDYAALVRPIEARATAVGPVLTVEAEPQKALPPMNTTGAAQQAFSGYPGMDGGENSTDERSIAEVESVEREPGEEPPLGELGLGLGDAPRRGKTNAVRDGGR